MKIFKFNYKHLKVVKLYNGAGCDASRVKISWEIHLRFVNMTRFRSEAELHQRVHWAVINSKLFCLRQLFAATAAGNFCSTLPHPCTPHEIHNVAASSFGQLWMELRKRSALSTIDDPFYEWKITCSRGAPFEDTPIMTYFVLSLFYRLPQINNPMKVIVSFRRYKISITLDRFIEFA